MILFGKSYLYAFDYLVSPTLSGPRDGLYLSTRDRTTILASYAESLGFAMPGYAERFEAERLPGINEFDFMISVADGIAKFAERVFLHAQKYTRECLGDCYSAEGESHASRCFSTGVPSPKLLSLGNLLNGAWAVYNELGRSPESLTQGVETVPLLTDLVIKSAELMEYESF
jgi:hypothetical protein